MITSKLYETKDMSEKTITIKNTSGIELHGLNDGGKLKIKVDRDGVPYDRNWRRRLKDSEIDGCVEIVSVKKKEVK